MNEYIDKSVLIYIYTNKNYMSLSLLHVRWQVLPETFFVPDGEPWELAPSTEGAVEAPSEAE